MAKLNITRDPRLFEPREKPCKHKRCLGLDLGTNCGVAMADFIPGKPIRQIDMILGMWDLSLGQYDSGPLRHIRLKQFLFVAEPDLVMFENVKYDPPQELMKGKGPGALLARVVPTAEFFGGLKTTVTTWCECRGIPAHGIEIAQIKKHATGKGNANKSMMITACNEKFGTDFDPSDEVYKKEGTDNLADAAFVCDIGLMLYSDGLT